MDIKSNKKTRGVASTNEDIRNLFKSIGVGEPNEVQSEKKNLKSTEKNPEDVYLLTWENSQSLVVTLKEPPPSEPTSTLPEQKEEENKEMCLQHRVDWIRKYTDFLFNMMKSMSPTDSTNLIKIIDKVINHYNLEEELPSSDSN